MTEGLPIEHCHVEVDSMELDIKSLLPNAPGMCFIDGQHKYEWAHNDIEICSKLIPKNGVLVVHDYSGGFPGVQKAVYELLGRTRWQSLYLDENREANDYRTIVIQRSM
jgi:hypothetical protein